MTVIKKSRKKKAPMQSCLSKKKSLKKKIKNKNNNEKIHEINEKKKMIKLVKKCIKNIC